MVSLKTHLQPHALDSAHFVKTKRTRARVREHVDA